MAQRKAAAGTARRAASGTASRKKTAGRAAASSAAKRRDSRAGAGGQKNKRTAASRGGVQKEYIDYALYYEILLWVVIACSILLFLSMLGLGGKLGRAVSGVFFGLFGVMGYVFPFLLFFLTAFLISNSRSRIARIKGFGAMLLFATLCGLFQLILVGYDQSYTLSEYYQAGSRYHLGGGWLGGALTSFFAPAIGRAGAAVVYVIMLIIGLVLLTQRSLFAGVKRGGQRVMSRAREGQERRRQWMEEQRQLRRERELSRQEEALHDADTLYDPASDALAERDIHVQVLPGEGKRAKRVSGVTRDTRLLPRSLTDKADSADAADAAEPPKIDTAAMEQDLDRLFDNIRTRAKRKDAAGRETLCGKRTADFGLPPGEDGGTAAEMSHINEYDAYGTASAAAGVTADTAPGINTARGIDAGPAAAAGTDIWPDAAAAAITNKAAGAAAAADTDIDTDIIEETGFAPARKDGMAGLERKALSGAAKTAEPEASAQEGASPAALHKKRVSQEEIEAGIQDVEEQIAQNAAPPKPEYRFPPLELLSAPDRKRKGTEEDDLRSTAAKLQKVFQTFHVNVKITDVTCGPSVTRYELMPEMGVKVSKIVALQDDLKLNLAVTDIRIEAPIPGKAAVGIEVPNRHATGVVLRELLEAREFKGHRSNLAYAVGKDIGGNIIVSDIAKMPHLLIAGATGSGKSVFINTLIMSILYKAKPEEVKMIMIDPKVVELSVYNGIPHLFIPVVTDPKKAAGALNWAVSEMMGRYQKFAEAGVRDLKGYNARIASLGSDVPEENRPQKMPQIVIIVDELADLMMVASSEVEDAICRLAQLARAAGIHLVIATQRPSVDVITGLIKANMPSRIAFSVSSGVDSRTVLDQIGAEKLLGNGDMLFYPQVYKQPLRVQGAYVSDAEVSAIVEFIKDNNLDGEQAQELKERMEAVERSVSLASDGPGGDVDELFAQAGRFIIEKDKASIGMLQRWFKIGFNRAARIMDQLSDAGVVGPDEGTKPRKVEMSLQQFEDYLEQN